MKSELYHEIVGSGPPLVLLHGWGWNSAVWAPLIPKLSQLFQLVMIDLPGSGRSALTHPEFDFGYIAPMLLKIVPDRATWLGWSLGGMLAWQMAVHHPKKVHKLITVASSPRFVASPDWPGVAEDTLAAFGDSLTTNYEKTLTDFLELQLRSKSVPASLFNTLLTQLFAADTHVNVTGLLAALKYLQITDLRHELIKVVCPSLHVFGSLDRLVPPKVASLIQPVNGTSVIISGSAHLPFLSHQKTFVDLIKPFALT